MATKFKREPKMFTTEPSVDEVGKGMKKGGKAKHMQYGGVMVPPTARPAMAPAVRPTGRRAPMAAMAAPAARMPMARKKGGSIDNEKAELRRVKAEIREDRKEDRNEHAEIKRVKGELKRHESMKAGKAHGYKAGGAPKAGPDVMGGLAGGLEATRANSKKTTGGVRAPGYKRGGSLGAKMDAFETKTTLKPKIDINDKVVSAKQTKSFNTKTGGVKNTTANGGAAGFKRGGKIAAKGMAIAKKYMTKTNTGNPMPTVKGGTKGIKQAPAGYKDGGHVAMTCKSTGGFATMKKMSKC